MLVVALAGLAAVAAVQPVRAEDNPVRGAMRLASENTGQRVDLRFRGHYRSAQSPDAVPAPVAVVAPVSAILTIGVGGDSARITVGASGGLGAVTIARAMDAVGAPVDFARMRRASLAGARSALSLGTISMPSGMPVTSAYLSSRYGMRMHPTLGTLRAHSGVDLAAPTGTPIRATSDGVVREADWRGGYGLLVELDHGGGMQTRYGHMSRLNVAAGQAVRKGDVIGYVGSTGRSTGPHVHYEMRFNGQAMNPLSRGHR